MILRLLKESIILSIESLISNKLRTLLSLLGITIGIFAIISVFTVIDSLRSSIEDSVQSLGNDIVYVQKWPWEFGPEYPWWKYMSRPQPSLNELDYIKKRSSRASSVCYMASNSKTVSYESNVAESTTIIAVSEDYPNLRNFEIDKGRFISPFEFEGGQPVSVIGTEISRLLFGKLNPIGKELKLDGRKVKVIGVFKKEGENIFNNSSDYQVLTPIGFFKKLYDLRNDEMNPSIMVKVNEDTDVDEMLAELNQIMRTIRRLRPLEEENFALNRSSMISQGFEQLFVVIDIAGMIIGGFSILVGGFGIANIMFVSVKERTKLIGIQKSLGAKNYMIMTQFLTESVSLSLMGGLAGLILIFIGTLFANYVTEMNFALSMGNIISGITISVVIGIVSGFAPALSASRLNPVVAINSNF
ncbi:MAG: ABC transporter [Bacteroidetes bacterium HGW-Bacteroidetes-21]|jgi:putative ABC transport system permease protein|nr:MAG: ABC transporter [Bacteroidetes bacterium HGW-Bacteroidetes-21]